MHRLLERQLRKATRSDGTVDYETFIRQVGLTYEEYERERNLQTHATQLMSDEMTQQYEELEQHRNNLEKLVRQRTAELVATNQKLEEESTRTKSIVDSVLEGIITIDGQGVIQTFNRGAEQIFGFTIAEVHGENVRMLMPSPYREQHDEYLRHYRRTGEKRIIGIGRELQGQRKDGTQFPMALSVSEIIIGGKPLYIGLVRDITQQKSKEEELRQAKAAAEAANEAKSDFLANMSHEIRTPMNGVLGMAGLLLDTELNAEQRGWTEIIRKSGENLLEVINDILDFSKIEAGKLPLVSANFDLAALVMEITDVLSPKTQEKGIELLVQFAPDLPRYVVGDPVRVRQVLMNLIGNAIKFTQKGHVLIRINFKREAEKQIKFMFEIEDTGIGIPSNKIEHIFDKFAQAEESTTRKFGGTGLGLSICRRLVGMMGGKILVKSELGKGSIFYFDARLGEATTSQETVEPLATLDLSNLRVLVIDDSRLNCEILYQYLRHWRMRCDTCHSADTALRLLEEATQAGDPYHFALLDYRIGGTNGLQLAEWIRSSAMSLDATLFMITALGQVITSGNLQEKGFAGFFLKPFYPDQLKTALQILWDAKQHGKQLPLVTRHMVSTLLRTQTKHSTIHPDMFTGSKILVVEDMKVNMMLITKILQKHGCEVTPAENGKEAVEKIRVGSFDLVFMDCQMPEMDGFEATRMIREEEVATGRHTIIVALTADAMTGDREKCLHVGMDDYLNKPLKQEQVTEILQKWLVP